MAEDLDCDFAAVALEHLALIGEHTQLREAKLHCHFAKLFLELALEVRQRPQLMTARLASPG